ncbi:Aste57867_10660 [Aphanomyces stellatus]|uniref:Aste57867_10660 protein n=1 Tax=Aphanomyces stellatus TaxID=120398 RepID=A0A485KQZ7_9STRA|nr:hypothetical protein As57867_010620 [Aphanomyces stellatus]VFT87532.1 Aste57867_10660 [Aphanomyces stellatus]
MFIWPGRRTSRVLTIISCGCVRALLTVTDLPNESSKLRQVELEGIKLDFSKQFWSKYDGNNLSEILNVDETGIYYDMPPRRTWAKVGWSSKVDKSQKHSDHLTAVLTIRADGVKSPILFVLNGTPGGSIEKHEVPTCPDSHIYLHSLLKHELVAEFPSVVLVDNLKSHVSHASVEYVCLDPCARAMGPLKSMMRSLWLKEKPVITAAEKRIAMIKRTIAAWDALSEVAVKKSFIKAIPQVVEL